MVKSKAYAIQRCEPRLPMEVAVQIAGNSNVPGVEMTFTENVSARGARVVTGRRWHVNDHLTIASLPGNFQSIARVAYCEQRRGDGYVVGLEFTDPEGRWVINPSAA